MARPPKAKEEKESQKEPVDCLMWVGTMYYPTVDTFLVEVNRVGACKRIARFFPWIDLGKTRVFLAHDEGYGVEEGFIFGYFTIADVEILVHNLDELPPTYSPDMTPVELAESCLEERRCGKRDQEGALYVVPYVLEEGFVELIPPRALEEFVVCKRFRGMLRIPTDLGDRIIEPIDDPSLSRIPPSRKALSDGPDPIWAKTNDLELIEAVENRGNLTKIQACLQYAVPLGWTRSQVMYRYAKLRKERRFSWQT